MTLSTGSASLANNLIKCLQNHVDFKIKHIKKLDGYDEVNYQLFTDDRNYILKSYPYSDKKALVVQAENEVLQFLKKKEPDAYPTPIPFKDGIYLKNITINDDKKICRILSYLEGDFLGDVSHSENLLHSLGRFLAKMNLKLLTFDNDVIRARKWEWDLQYLSLNKKYICDIPNEHDRNIVRYFFQQFEENVVPVLPELRTSIIHNDANEWNVLTQDNEVSGLIDFGDLACSPLINELAVAITYACYDKEDPLHWATIIIDAYNNVLPLQEQELDILYYLIAGRLCISVCNSAHAKKHDPDNSYATVSEKNAWAMLRRWLQVNPQFARNSFRSVAGYSVLKSANIEDLVKRRHKVMSPILSLSYQLPIHMERAAFQYMYDADGNTYLDAYNNIPHVGHSHPRVVEAGQRQMAKLNTNTRYLYDQLAEYAENLLSTFPDKLNKVYFVNSGSAAADLALRIAFSYSRHRNLMVMEHGYHGNTSMSMAVSDYKFSNKKGPGQQDFILKTTLPDTYRGQYKPNDGTAGQLYAQDAINMVKLAGKPVAAFISEPIVGCGGQVPLAKGYLKALYPFIRKQGGICISDEVQTGFGRLGDHFWGYEAQDVVPDMVILGKPMGNGHPIGAVVTTDEIAESFGKGVEFFSSFGGNPVSCAIGQSVLNVIKDEQLQKNAKSVGDHYKYLLNSLKNKHSCIGDVRGSGLFLGIEIVKTGTMEPDTELANKIKNIFRERHILISTDGPYDSVIKTKPPLCFTKQNTEQVAELMDEILSNHQ